MRLSCPEFRLRGWQRCQCAARRCRAAAFCCEKLRFHQGCTLGAPDVPVGPSHFAARPKGVAAQRKVRGVKRGQETILGVLSPFVPAGEHRHFPRRRAAAIFLRRGHGVFSAARRRRLPAAFGGNFYDGRQFPSFTQVVSLSRTIVTIYPFLPKLSATIRPSAVWKI